MAAQLWLLRHGEAEPHGRRPDEQRELTERGERQARAAGGALAALDVRLDAVLTSPRVRALETARLACEVLPGAIEPETHQSLSAGFDGSRALELLARWEDGARVLVVGHEPDLSSVVEELTGARVDLKKGGLAMVRIGDQDAGNGGMGATAGGELIVLTRPRELALMMGMAASKV
jgi:phosphohistidine phosphatase